jgi:biotin carboxyl carrier protein
VEIEVEGVRFQVDVRRDGDRWRAVVDGRDVLLDVCRVGGRLSLLTTSATEEPPPTGGREEASLRPAVSHDLAVERRSRGRYLVYTAGQVLGATVPSLARPARAAGHGPSGAESMAITAPMPGRIVRVLVNRGDVVRMRQPLVVIEAMKMENELRAPADGIVMEIRAREGALVETRAVLAVLARPGTGTDQRTEEP